MENNQEGANQSNRTPVTLGDLKSKNYLSLKIGETVELTVKALDKVMVGNDFALSGVNYRYEITTDTNEVLSISAWKLWNALREVLEANQKIIGLKLKLSHVDREQYTVEVLGL